MASLAMTRFYKPSSGPFVFSSHPRPVQHKKKYSTVSLDNKFFLKNDALYHNAFNTSYNNRSQDGPLLSSYSSFLESRTNKKFKQDSHSMLHSSSFDKHKRSGGGKKVAWQERSGTPEAVQGRQHAGLQTELYLEELGDVVVEMDEGCQTDAFLQRPSSPLFVPAKTGIDQETQILEGDLWDFDMESRPVVEVLVGKVVEQSLIEVMQEEELASLKERQKMFEEARAAEVQEEERLEEEERRRKEEKLRRMKQHNEMIRKQKETAEKIAARAFAQSFVADLVPQVITSLSTHGFFSDPVEMELEREFMEDLMTGVGKKLRHEILSRKMVEVIVAEVLLNRESNYLSSINRGDGKGRVGGSSYEGGRGDSGKNGGGRNGENVSYRSGDVGEEKGLEVIADFVEGRMEKEKESDGVVERKD